MQMSDTTEACVRENADAGLYVTTIQACSEDKPPYNTDMEYAITGEQLFVYQG